MGDPADLNFMKLKKWLKEAGCPADDLNKCVDKEALLKLLPAFKDAGAAAAASKGPTAAAPVAKVIVLSH